MIAFGQLLKRHRQMAGMSVRELANRLGISHVFVLKIENGSKKSLAPKHWPKLCEALPSLNPDLLQEARGRSTSISVRIVIPIDADDETVELLSVVAHAFARKINQRWLTPTQISTILGVLEDGTDL